ncbi:MAG: thymidylate kinase [Candidatus Taylorbacteria bacterium]|nr:thymidylate kinase [Candidatus Taylorbacteria bacterium]
MHIVIEGTDGSGKATQAKMLTQRFIDEGQKAELLDFPRYGTPSCYFVEKYLHGGFGTAEEVGPFAGSLFYALDRYDFAPTIRGFVANNTHVVCDRYTSANMGHQAGKIPLDQIGESGKPKVDEYLEWLDNLEFNLLKIPRPDKTVFLYVDPVINQRLMASRADKEYLKGKKQDIHEADLEHLKKASEAFLYVAKKYNWIVIDCAPRTTESPEGEMLSREIIHEMVWKAVQM